MVSRIARRLALKEETVWARLDELRKQRHGRAPAPGPRPAAEAVRRNPITRAPLMERELLELLLAEPAFVPEAMAAVHPADVAHPEARGVLQRLYDLQAAGEPPTLDQLRVRLDDALLAAELLELQDIGRRHPDDRGAWLRQVLARFEERRTRPVTQELQNQLHAASDHAEALELLRQLQNRNVVGAG
jgi:DNA primase